MGHSEKILKGEDERYNSLSRHIFNKDNNEPYVFISYKSDNDTTVLSTIVYNLVNQYGLRVYFDADFAKKGALWTTQVQENMKNPYCRGVLAFVSNRYTTSYATIMELMYSQTTEADTQPRKRDKDEGEGKPVVPVNLESIKPLYELEQTYSTGLGDQTYDEYHDDGTKEKVVNLSFKTEQGNFDEYFDEMVEREYIKGKGKRLYKKKKLEWRACREIFNEMYTLFGQNENRYNEEDKNFYENLYETIKDSIGKDVFDKDLIGLLDSEIKTKTKTDKNKSENQISENHSKKEKDYGTKTETSSNNNSDSDTDIDTDPEPTNEETGYDYTIFGKEYVAGKKEQGKIMYDAFVALVERYPECVDLLTQKNSIARAEDVKNADTQQAYPTYFRGCKEHFVNGKKYLIGTSFGFDAKISEIKGMFKICGANLSEFVLNGVPLSEGKKKDKNSNISRTDVVIPNKVPKDDAENDNKDGFVYSFCGQKYESKKLSFMMHDVFELIAQKHPEKISLAAKNQDIQCVLYKRDLEELIKRNQKPTDFRACSEHTVLNEVFCLGTSYNRAAAIKQLKKIISLCNDESINFEIVSEPDIEHKGSNNKKKPLDVN